MSALALTYAAVMYDRTAPLATGPKAPNMDDLFLKVGGGH
jgi:hypothetical protein